LEKLITVKTVAIGDICGFTHFTKSLDTMNKITEGSDPDSRAVEMLTVDVLSSKLNPTMIKLDVEGFETECIRGAHKTLTNESLKVILVETVSTEIKSILKMNGFVQMYYDPFKRQILVNPLANLVPSNSIFVRDVDFVQSRVLKASQIDVLNNLI
jgi:hypothetical protein